ncbi:MAG TPA: DUF3566 domain-containing protein [Actinomycetes bacterium]|nr:DUF3566 domain-containing protein [Actinomycetes bacterium]
MTTTSGSRPMDSDTGNRPPVTSQPQGALVVPSARSVPAVRSRRVRMTVQRVDPWTVLRLSFLLSLAVAAITVVAGLLLWGLLAAGGVFTSVDRTLEDVLGDGALTVTQYFGFGKVLSVSLLIAAIDVVLITALATIGAFLFNLATSVSGGLELTVTEE